MPYQGKYMVAVKRHKPSPRPRTIILIRVIAVTSGKHVEHENETACFVICTALEPLRLRRCTVLYGVSEHAAQT